MGRRPSANVSRSSLLRWTFGVASTLLASAPAAATESHRSDLRVQVDDIELRSNHSHQDARRLPISPRASFMQTQVSTAVATPQENMDFVVSVLAKFKAAAQANVEKVEARHNLEADRLESAINASADDGVKLALSQSVTSNEQNRIETKRVYKNMVKFSNSLGSLLYAAGNKGRGCAEIVCGPHASCTTTALGSQCICNEGYIGSGKDCRPPPAFIPKRLLFESPGGQSNEAADISVAVFEHSSVVIAWRDVTKDDGGRMATGIVGGAGLVDMSPPDIFTKEEGKAYEPIVVGNPSKVITIAWRDEHREGSAWVRSAAIGANKIRGATKALTWGEPLEIARGQSHKMAIAALPRNRVALMYSVTIPKTAKTPEENFGEAVLIEVGDLAQLKTLGDGRFRFVDTAVCRLEVTKLTPNTFIIGARGAKAVDDMDSDEVTRQEAMAVFGEMVDDGLVFDPNVLNFAPAMTNIWARGISMIAANTFAYAYQEGANREVKLAIASVDETSHKMKVIAGPRTIHKGFSPYVKMISMPYTPADPHTLVMFEGDDGGHFDICSWKNKQLINCEEFTWLAAKLKYVAGAHLGGGKSFMAFITETGIPYYTVVGLSKK